MKNKLNRIFNMATDKIWKRIGLMFISLILLISLISVTTGTNIIAVGLNKLFSGSDTGEQVKEALLKSDRYDDKKAGSYAVTKSFKWTSSNTIDLTYNLNSYGTYENRPKDILFVLANLEPAEKSLIVNSMTSIMETTLKANEGKTEDKDKNRIGILENVYNGNGIDFTDDLEYIKNEFEKTDGSAEASSYSYKLSKMDAYLQNYYRSTYNTEYNKIIGNNFNDDIRQKIIPSLGTKLDSTLEKRIEKIVESKLANPAKFDTSLKTIKNLINPNSVYSSPISNVKEYVAEKMKEVAVNEINNAAPEYVNASESISLYISPYAYSNIFELFRSTINEEISEYAMTFSDDSTNDEIDILVDEIAKEIAQELSSAYNGTDYLQESIYNEAKPLIWSEIYEKIDSYVNNEINSEATKLFENYTNELKNSYYTKVDSFIQENGIETLIRNEITKYVDEYKVSNPTASVSEIEQNLGKHIKKYIEESIFTNIKNSLYDFTNSELNEKIKKDIPEIVKMIETDTLNYPEDKINSLKVMAITSFKEFNNVSPIANVISRHIYSEIIADSTTRNPRDVIVIWPINDKSDSDKDKSLYRKIKESYPQVTINAIQFNLGEEYLTSIKDISDNQYIATTMDISEVMNQASKNPKKFKTFEMTDYINTDYFSVNKVSNVYGNATFSNDEGLINWQFDSDTVRTGINTNLTVEVKINDKALEKVIRLYKLNDYKQNKGWFVGGKVEAKEEMTPYSSTESLTIQTVFKLNYDSNIASCPGKENDASIETNLYSPYTRVTKKSEIPEDICEGYQFKNWEIADTDNDVIIESPNTFLMADHDITIRAAVTKLEVQKSFNGSLYSTPVLFDTIKYNAEQENIASLKTLEDEVQPIYYYHESDEDSNVIFGGYCWQIIRTTNTKGVKLLYNGLPKIGDTGRKVCENIESASKTIGTSTFNENSIRRNNDFLSSSGYMIPDGFYFIQWSSTERSNYYNGFSVQYDNESKKYTLYSKEGNISQSKMYKDLTFKSLTDSMVGGRYICNSTSNPRCTKVRYQLWRRGNPDPSKENWGAYSWNNHSYIELENGDDLNSALNNSLGYITKYSAENNTMELISTNNKDINRNDSAIKNKIDTWYKDNIIAYGNFLEDTVWCNNRSINSDFGSFDSSSSNTTSLINPLKGGIWESDDLSFDNRAYYNSYFKIRDGNISSKDLVCERITDSFTVSPNRGNGVLRYPVGMITAEEARLVGDKAIALTGKTSGKYDQFWTMTPRALHGLANWIYLVGYDHTICDGAYNTYAKQFYVRPSISLRYGVKYSEGNGTKQDPYIIDYSS